MARLENRGQRGLPPPPAPPRRGANPWKLSETARRREPTPRQEESASRLLEELLAGTPPEEAQPRAAAAPARKPEPQNPWKPRRRWSFWPLLVLLLIGGVLVKIAMEARESGDWRQLIPAIFAILFIAHGWWRSRRRHDERGGDRNGA